MGVRMRQSGTFNMGRQKDQWKPFTADVCCPGLPAYVHDSYANGSGLLHGAGGKSRDTRVVVSYTLTWPATSLPSTSKGSISRALS